MAYFDCIVGGSGKGNTLVVTCADDLAGATITCTNGTKTYTKTCPSTAPYEVTFYGLEAGTWTVSATVSGNTYTTTVVVTDYEAELGGFNWKTWVDLSKNYTSSDFTDLDDLLDTELAVRELMTIHACVDYLAGIAADSADVETIIGNDLCAKWINLSDYALDTLYANTIIKGYMDTADKYGYGEWALVGQVPKMTSNTPPYGSLYASYYNTGYEAYRAFDDNSTDGWYGAGGSVPSDIGMHYIQYDFGKVISGLKLAKIIFENSTGDSMIYRYQISASANGTDFDVIKSENALSLSGNQRVEITAEMDGDYRYIRFANARNTTASTTGLLSSFQVYSWAPKGNVPVMTSNTTPYGTVTRNAVTPTGGGEAYCAFDGNDSTFWRYPSGTGDYIRYQFTNPICIKSVYIKNNGTGTTSLSTQKLRVSNDGTTWVSLNDILLNKDGIEVDVNSDNYYLYAEMNLSNYVSSDGSIGITTLQFYGRELSVSVPVMTGNTTPYGEVKYSSAQNNSSDILTFGAFDNNANTAWACASNDSDRWCGYDFGKKVKIKAIYQSSRSAYPVTTYKIQTSNTGSADDWSDITESLSNKFESINPTDAYRYWRLKCLTGGSGNIFTLDTLQFYGLDYSEKEFEEGTTKKWLYDHGVELVDMDLTGYSEYHALVVDVDGIKNSDNIELSVSAGDYKCLIGTQEKVDFTPYTYLMGKYRFKSIAGNAQLKIVGVKQDDNNASSSISLSQLYASSNAQSAIDVSSINALDYPIFRTYGYTPSVGNLAQDFEVYELWLE